MKKKKLLSLALILIMMCVIAGCSNKEKETATNEFNAAVSTIEENNSSIKKASSELQTLIDSEIPPLDASLLDTSKATIDSASKQIIEIPEIPSKTEDIKSKTEELTKQSDCQSTLSELETATSTLSTSIAQMKQVTAPTEGFVTERLTGLPNITEMAAVTEDNDPNGNLNKAGGYTSCIYFTSDLVNQAEVYGDSIIDKGTDGGGAVEVYTTEKDANTRNDYLASFDGATALNSGSHSVVGTVVIRTSANLTATQQKEMEANIYNSLTTIK